MRLPQAVKHTDLQLVRHLSCRLVASEQPERRVPVEHLVVAEAQREHAEEQDTLKLERGANLAQPSGGRGGDAQDPGQHRQAPALAIG